MTPYYERNGITIYNGDCLEVMLQLIGLFDAIIADLPYGTTACSWDTIIPFVPLWDSYRRLIKDNGAVVLFGSQPFTSKLILSNLEWFRVEWIWVKSRPSGHLNAKIKPLTSKEDIVIFAKHTSTYNPQGLVRINKIQHNSLSDSMRGEGNKTSTVSGGIRFEPYLQEYGNYPDQILKFASTANPVHPTQKPVDLLQYLIRTYTNPGEIVLDNTMGSGTTLVAAQREGRQAVGIELDEDYCKIAVERLRQPSFFSIPDKPRIEAKQEALF